MAQEQIITTIPADEFWARMEHIIDSKIRQHKITDKTHETYSITAVAKKLKRSNAKVVELINIGLLKATPDGRISARALNEYLDNTI